MSVCHKTWLQSTKQTQRPLVNRAGLLSLPTSVGYTKNNFLKEEWVYNYVSKIQPLYE